MEGNGARYIRLLTELYNVPEAAQQKLWDNVDRINNVLKDFYWSDIERQVSVFYAYKSDKTYPKIGQIVALLTADRSVERSYAMEPNTVLTRPQTRIESIKGLFFDTCKWLHENGVLFFDYFDKVETVPYGNKMRLVRKKDRNGVENTVLWNLKWDCDSAIRAAREHYPDVFAKFEQFGKLRYAEEFALAVQLGTMKL